MELITTTDLSLAVQQELTTIELRIKELKEVQEAYKQRLCELMELNGVEKIENDYFEINFIPTAEVTQFDKDLLKEKYEDIYIECHKKSTRKSYVKILLK